MIIYASDQTKFKIFQLTPLPWHCPHLMFGQFLDMLVELAPCVYTITLQTKWSVSFQRIKTIGAIAIFWRAFVIQHENVSMEKSATAALRRR